MPPKRVPPPPPRRQPSPRRAASRTASKLTHVAVPEVPQLALRYGGVSKEAEKLQDHRDDINDIKISLLECQDMFDNMSMRQAQWDKITNNKGTGSIAVEALGFHARALTAIDDEERQQDRVVSQLPEMARVLTEMERAKQDRALTQQSLQVKQQWAQTAGRTLAAPIGDAGTLSQRRPTQQMVNPYSVVPSQRVAMSQLFSGAPAASGGAAHTTPGGYPSSPPPAATSSSPYPYVAPPSYQSVQQGRPPYNAAPSYGYPNAPGYPPPPPPPAQPGYGYAPSGQPAYQNPYPQYPQTNQPGARFQAL